MGCMRVALGAAVGAAVGVAGMTLAITVSEPTYYHDSGSPPLILGIFVAGPVGLIIGGFVGAKLGRRRS